MHRFLPETRDDLIGLELSGKLDSKEYREILPVIESAIQRHGQVRLFWEMIDFDGWTPGGMWADEEFDVRHPGEFRRITMVGEKKWQEWMTSVMKPFTRAEVRYFEEGDRAAALAWLG